MAGGVPGRLPGGPRAGITTVMARTATMWAVLLVCLFGLGPALTLALSGLRGGDGGTDATFLLNDSLARGMVGLVVTVGAAGLVGVATARFLGASAGLGAMAMTLIAPAMRLGELVPILRWAEPGAFRTLAFEGLLLALLAAAVAVLLERASHARAHGSGEERPARLLSIDSAIATGVALAAGAVAAWVIAREPTKGQSIFAGAAAGLAGAGAARLVATRAPLASIALGVMLVAALGPILGMTMGGGDALRAAYEQRLPALANPIPIDWLAGSMLGLPLGLNWAASVIEKRAPKASRAGVAA